MTRWENYSGEAVSVPVVGKDVTAGEIVDVPDDVLMPTNYFRPVDVVSAAVADDNVTVIVEETD